MLKRQVDGLAIVNKLKWINLFKPVKIRRKTGLIFLAIKRNFLSFFYLKKLRHNYDIVYSISSVLDLVIFPYFLKRKDAKVKWVVVFDNTVPLLDPGNKFIRFLVWIFFNISLILLKKADKIFAISEDLKQFLLKKGFKKEQIVVTGNAVECAMIKMAKKNYSCNIDALFIGRINETKGIFDMLKVLAIVKIAYPDFQLAIMGDGDEATKNKFKNKIKTMELVDNIQFLGYKTGIEKFNILKSSKCFWFLSESESFGIALLEAVCSGLPSFAYDLAPYKNIYKNNEVMIFNKNDYYAVANKVIEIFNKKEFDNKKGELLVEKYSWDNIAKIEFDSFNV